MNDIPSINGCIHLYIILGFSVYHLPSSHLTVKIKTGTKILRRYEKNEIISIITSRNLSLEIWQIGKAEKANGTQTARLRIVGIMLS